MAVVYLALGSNVGDTTQHITDAQKLLQTVLNCPVSALLYNSKAVGYIKQADFLNTVVSGRTKLKPKELLARVKDIEKKLVRIERFRWGPREIDIDIIFYDEMVMDDSELTLPHPRYSERDFVLKPLCDLCEDLIDPRSQQPVKTLLKKLPAAGRSIQP